MSTINYVESLAVLHCSACGMAFAFPQGWKDARQEDHATFYCPRGDGQHFPAQTEADRLRKALNASELEATRRANEVSALKKEAIRLARRTRAGVCPCCNRTFQALSRHMSSKHPEAS